MDDGSPNQSYDSKETLKDCKKRKCEDSLDEVKTSRPRKNKGLVPSGSLPITQCNTSGVQGLNISIFLILVSLWNALM